MGVERDVGDDGSRLEIELLAALRIGIPSFEVKTITGGVFGFACRFTFVDRLRFWCARCAFVVQVEGDSVSARLWTRLVRTLFTGLIYADFHNVIIDIGKVHLTLIIADGDFNSGIRFGNFSKNSYTLRFVKGNMRIGDAGMIADNIVIGNPVIWIIGASPSVFPVIRVRVVVSFTVYLNFDTI